MCSANTLAVDQPCANNKVGVIHMQSNPWGESDFRIMFGTSMVDYDPEKDEYNRKEHKYALESAVALLTRVLMPSVFSPPYTYRDASTVEERRHEHMTIDDSKKVVFLVTTMREGETIRVISLRRAHESEREAFAEATGFHEPA